VELEAEDFEKEEADLDEVQEVENELLPPS
jgi:hypothetical protein